jgi:hypothetical protein
MKTFSFNITERMYEDIFSKKMPSHFFDGLKFVGGNSFNIEISEYDMKTNDEGKSVPVYEREDMLTSILERYGCAWQEYEDTIIDRGSKGLRNKKSGTDV